MIINVENILKKLEITYEKDNNILKFNSPFRPDKNQSAQILSYSPYTYRDTVTYETYNLNTFINKLTKNITKIDVKLLLEKYGIGYTESQKYLTFQSPFRPDNSPSASLKNYSPYTYFDYATKKKMYFSDFRTKLQEYSKENKLCNLTQNPTYIKQHKGKQENIQTKPISEEHKDYLIYKRNFDKNCIQILEMYNIPIKSTTNTHTSIQYNNKIHIPIYNENNIFQFPELRNPNCLDIKKKVIYPKNTNKILTNTQNINYEKNHLIILESYIDLLYLLSYKIDYNMVSTLGGTLLQCHEQQLKKIKNKKFTIITIPHTDFTGQKLAMQIQAEYPNTISISLEEIKELKEYTDINEIPVSKLHILTNKIEKTL